MFENNGYVHVYSHGAEADNPVGSNCFINSIIQSILSFTAKFPPLNDLVTVFPIKTYIRPNLTLPLNKSRSTQGHHLFKLCRA